MSVIDKTWKGKLSLICSLAAYFIVVFIKLSPSVVMPQYQVVFGLTDSRVGILSGLYFFSYAIMQLVAGPLSRKIGASRVIAFGLIVSSLGLVVFGFGNSFFLLVLGRLLLGFGSGPIFVAMLFSFQENYDSAGYVRNYSISVFVSNLGSACSSAPLKLLLTYVSFRSFFMVLALCSSILAVVTVVLSSRNVIRKENTRFVSELLDSTKEIIGNARLRSCLILWLTVSGGILSYQGLWCTKWTAMSFPDYENLSGLGGTVISLGIMISSIVGKKLFTVPEDRCKSVAISGWLHILALLLVVVSKSVFVLKNFWVSIVCDFLFGLLMGNACLQVPVLVKQESMANNATIMGVLNFFANLFSQMMQSITGSLVDVTSSYVVTFSIVIVLYSFLMLFVDYGLKTRRS